MLLMLFADYVILLRDTVVVLHIRYLEYFCDGHHLEVNAF